MIDESGRVNRDDDHFGEVVDRILREMTAGRPGPAFRAHVMDRIERGSAGSWAATRHPLGAGAWRSLILSLAACALLAVALVVWLHLRPVPAPPVAAPIETRHLRLAEATLLPTINAEPFQPASRQASAAPRASAAAARSHRQWAAEMSARTIAPLPPLEDTTPLAPDAFSSFVQLPVEPPIAFESIAPQPIDVPELAVAPIAVEPLAELEPLSVDTLDWPHETGR